MPPPLFSSRGGQSSTLRMKGKAQKRGQHHKKRNRKSGNNQPQQQQQRDTKKPCKQTNSLYGENERQTRLAELLEEERKGKEIKPKGLNNLGNTCFLNAVLQNVARLSALRSYFLSQSMPTGEQGLTLSLRVFFHTMWLLQDSNNNSTIRPNKLLDLLGTHSSRFRGFEQQDAHEALRALLESLMEEASTMNNTEDTTNSRSWVDDIFLGKLQSCVECEQCHSVSKVEEPFLDISLSLESQDTEETCCSVAGGCHDVTKSPNYPMNTARDENTFPTFPVVLYDNNNNNNNSDPPMVSLFDEEDIHQATLGLDSLFVESNIVTSNHCFSQKNTTQGTLYPSIQDSLQAFLSPEILQGENAYYCESCNRRLAAKSNRTVEEYSWYSPTNSSSSIRTKAKKRFVFKRLAPVLIFHLKRFRQVFGGQFEKVSGNISFPLEWNLSSYYDNSDHCHSQEDCVESVDYYLSGIVVHQGSLEWGHYIAYIRASCSPQQHLWYCCNDEHVTLVEEDQVLSSEAYLLFYCKK